MKNHAENLGWEVGVDFPVWANTEIYVKTISNGYLLPERKTQRRILESINAVARRLNKPQLLSKFFDYIWKGWLNLPHLYYLILHDR